MTECRWCHQEHDKPLEHLSECQHAPEEGREMARAALASRKDYAKQDTCCRMRRKILLKPVAIPEEYCGVPDSEMLDVMTFEKFHGHDVVQPKFCPWCGKPWVTTGLKVI